MLTYILQTSICWLGFYLLYVLLLRKETFFRLNRWYLLGTLAVGLVIPLVDWPSFAAEDNPAVVYLAPISVGVHQVEVTVVAASEQPESIDWMQVLTWLYWLGVAVFMVRCGIGLVQIFNLYKNGEKLRSGSLRLVYTEKYHLPFSFFNYVFWSRSFEAEHEDKLHILRHEEAHISGWHTLDVLLLEVLGIFLWCSPMIYFYRKSLKTIHEYLADAAVLQTTHRKQYGKLLLKQSMSGLQIALAHQFFHSQLKDRILMMTRTQSKRQAIVKYLPLIPLLALAIMLFSNEEAMAKLQEQQAIISSLLENGTFDTDKVEQKFRDILKTYETVETTNARKQTFEKFAVTFRTLLKEYPDRHSELEAIAEKVTNELGLAVAITRNEEKITEDIVLLMEEQISTLSIRNFDTNLLASNSYQSPIFSGCEDTICSNQKLMEFVYKNIKYPASAREKAVQGTVVIYYTVEESGAVTNVGVARSVNSELDEEVMRIVKEMPRWKPAMKDGKPISMTLTLPVRYKLDSADESLFESEREQALAKLFQGELLHVVGYTTQPGDEVFKVVEEMPRFPGCEDVEGTDAEKRKCADQKMLEFIYKNINYPKEAREARAEGTVVIQFIVDENGNLYDHKIVREPNASLGAEAIRVAKLLPGGWKPGIQRGRKVKVQFNLPVKFKLTDEDKTAAKEVASTAGNDEVFKIVEEMPRFPGCEDVEGTDAEKKKCADQKMLEFIYKNLIYPEKAKKAGVEGMAVVSFIVEKDGTISSPEIYHSLGAGTDEELIRLIDLMPKWIPGKQRGRNMRVQFSLPVKFRLDSKTEATAQAEELPRFSSCEEKATLKDKQICANQEMVKFISSQLKYPSEAKAKGVEGVVVVSFKVKKDGSLDNMEIAKGIGSGCDEEALRVIKLMPKWIPGKKNGEFVDTDMVLPIKFNLPQEKSVVQPATANTLKLQNFSAAPNPTDSDLTIRFQAEAKPIVVTISDATGKQLFRQEVKNFDGSYQKQLDVRQAAKGLLLIVVQQEDKVFTQQVVVQ